MKHVLAVGAFLALFSAAGALFGASEFFDKGEALFVQNRPQDARPLLESALSDDPSNEKTYLYLGIIYQQLGDLQRAIDVLKKGVAVAAADKDVFFYNLGNDYFTAKDFPSALEMYTSAIAANKSDYRNYLNRGTTSLQLQNFDRTLGDYALFLQLAPADHPQRPNVEKIMALLRQAQDDKEKAQQAEAAKQQAELAKQQALMKDVLNSLNNAGDSTKNLSVESINGQDDPVNVDIKD